MTETTANKKTPIYKVLYFQVICAILIGVLLGHFAPHIGEMMKPFGDGFIKLIKMIIAPVIFCTPVTAGTPAWMSSWPMASMSASAAMTSWIRGIPWARAHRLPAPPC